MESVALVSDVLVALGANLGHREKTIRRAWECIAQLDGVQCVKLSALLETVPVGGPENQPYYLNAVGRLTTGLFPQLLWERLHEIEKRLGRVRKERWGPRRIDLDILLFGNMVIRTEHLTIPHPRMHERLFVLGPALEVAPEMRDPRSGQSVRELFERLSGT